MVTTIGQTRKTMQGFNKIFQNSFVEGTISMLKGEMLGIGAIHLGYRMREVEELTDVEVEAEIEIEVVAEREMEELADVEESEGGVEAEIEMEELTDIEEMEKSEEKDAVERDGRANQDRKW